MPLVASSGLPQNGLSSPVDCLTVDASRCRCAFEIWIFACSLSLISGLRRLPPAHTICLTQAEDEYLLHRLNSSFHGRALRPIDLAALTMAHHLHPEAMSRLLACDSIHTAGFDPAQPAEAEQVSLDV
jgi:hypothetical protein